jgi:addiction module HigA family antidote
MSREPAKSTGKASGKTPGSVFKDKYIDKFGLSVSGIAKAIGENPIAIRNFVTDKKFSIELALKIAKYVGNKPEEWIELQKNSRLAALKKDEKFQSQLKEIIKIKEPKEAPKEAKVVKGTKGAKAANTDKASPPKKATTGAKRGRKPKVAVESVNPVA